MNKYKLGNIIKKELLKSFKNSEIHKMKFSFSYLNKLCNTYPIIEYLFNYYCCYGEDICCWQDEEVCWMRAANIKELNSKIYQSLKKSLKKNFNIYNRKIWIAENNKMICFCIPLRDSIKEDIILVFDKNKML